MNSLFGLVLVALFGVPAAAAWPYIVASALLQTLYLVLTTRAHAHGDMPRPCPITRGTSPVVVTAVP